MKKYTETTAERSLELLCFECEVDIYTCDGCKGYFEPGSIIFCDTTDMEGYHLCEFCKNEEYS